MPAQGHSRCRCRLEDRRRDDGEQTPEAGVSSFAADAALPRRRVPRAAGGRVRVNACRCWNTRPRDRGPGHRSGLAQRQAGDILAAPGATFVRGFPWAFRFDDRGNRGWGRGIVCDSNGNLAGLQGVTVTNSRIQVRLSSPPDRSGLVADLMMGSVQLAEVNSEDGPLRIEFCARPDGEPWALDLDDLRAAIDEAVRPLLCGHAAGDT